MKPSASLDFRYQVIRLIAKLCLTMGFKLLIYPNGVNFNLSYNRYASQNR